MKIPVELSHATTAALRIATRAARALAPLLLLAVTAQAQHECVPYEPTEAGEVINSNCGWEANQCCDGGFLMSR